MSTQVTEAHRKLAADLCRHATGSNRALHHVPKFAQLIADSEARAVASALSNVTCTHHNDQQRGECPVCLVTQLRARAERAEAVLSDPQQLHAHCLRNLNEGQIAHLFGERMTEIVNRAEKAEVELNLWQEGCIVREEDRLVTLRQERELAAERARLDWLLQDDVTRFDVSYHDRADIDAAMKEGAK